MSTNPKTLALSPDTKVLGADIIVDAFLRHAVKQVFIFPGGTIGPILDVVEKRTDIEIVCPRTEQGAGYAAIGYAKVTGKPCVFMVTSGPGVATTLPWPYCTAADRRSRVSVLTCVPPTWGSTVRQQTSAGQRGREYEGRRVKGKLT